jgi:hypothetical protein
VYIDQSWFVLWPRVAETWARQRRPLRLPKAKSWGRTERPPSCGLYADMDARTRQVRGEWHQTWNQRETWQHLKGVMRRYAGQGVRALVILWDNAPWHVAAWVHRLVTRYNRWAKRRGHLRVLLVALPRRAPWLMPLEAVFRQTKRAVGPRPHVSLATLRGAVDRRLERRNAWVDQQHTAHRSKSLLST